MHGHGRSVHFFVEPARHRQNRIANRLALQPPHAHAMQQHIAGVLGFGGSVGGFAAHLIRARKHDFPDEFFGGPPVFHQPMRQPIEQFRMGRRFAEHTKVIGARHDAASKEVMPNAVGVHAGGQRIGGIGDVIGQHQPSRAGSDRRIFANQRGQKSSRHFHAKISVPAANEDFFVPRRAFEHHRHHGGPADGVGLRGVFPRQPQCLALQRHVRQLGHCPGGRAVVGRKPKLLDRRVSIRLGATAGGVAVGQVGQLHVTFVAFPHRHVEGLPMRRFVVHSPREAAVNGVANNFEIINHQIDAPVRAEREQVHVVFRERESGRPQRALQLTTQQTTVQPARGHGPHRLRAHGELAWLRQRTHPRFAVGKPILAARLANVGNELIPFGPVGGSGRFIFPFF